MTTPSSQEVTALLLAWRLGDQAAFEKLTPLVYDELHRLAARYMRREGPGHTLQTSALVNEAFVHLLDQRQIDWQNRAHFFGVAANLMRHILLDHARSYARIKRGGGALELDPALAEAYASLGFIKYKYEWDWLGAEAALRQAIELKSNYSTAHHWLGECLSLIGRFEEALEALRRAEQLEPLSLAIKEDIGLHWYRSRQFDRATQQFLEVRALDPSYARVRSRLMRIYELQGRYEEALAEQLAAPIIHRASREGVQILKETARQAGWRGYWQKFLELHQAGHVGEDAQFIATVHLRLGDHEKALLWMEKSFAERGGAPLQIKTEPIYDPLRGDPRFNALLRRAGHTP